MADRYFNHIVGCLETSIKTAEDGVDCRISAVTAQGAVDLLKEQQERIERLQPKVGKWVTVMHLPQNKEFKRCTCCDDICMGWDGETGVTYNYCPNCGAKMESGDGE